MAERWSARELLGRARRLYDTPASPLAQTALRAGRTLFASGGQWMRQALEHLRDQALPGSARSLNGLGFVKYGLACAGAGAVLVLTLSVCPPWLVLAGLPVSVLVFYAIEVQMVFLFPCALEGSSTPYKDAARLTRQAGGTVAAMRVVLPLATVMLLGGFVGRGFVRCWCLGCLAICLWYDDLRRLSVPSVAETPTPLS